MIKSKNCPLLQGACIEESCAWWSDDKCAMLEIAEVSYKSLVSRL